MSAESPIEVLERLCAESVSSAREETLEVSRDFYDMVEYREMELVEREFSTKHKRIVEEIVKRWGQPTFSGNPESPGFPDWAAEETIVLATWEKGGGFRLSISH